MTQTLALLLDAYRDLNARKLFWITLILSAFFIGAFTLLGVDAKGFKILWFHWPMQAASFLYKSIFSFVVIGIWLTWAATILALVSTAGIFPDLIGGGTIDLYLSKPISRLRLFLTKYFTGLLFVSLQVLVFSVGSFLALGLRGGEWKLSLFLAIPIVLAFYSYLFSVCVFLGLVTRSTIAALLLTIVFWGLCWAIHQSEQISLLFRTQHELEVEDYRWQLQETATQIAWLQANPDKDIGGLQLSVNKARHEKAQRRLDELAATRWPTLTHRVAYGLNAIVPKTTETIALLDRILFNQTELPDEQATNATNSVPGSDSDEGRRTMQKAAVKVNQVVRARTVKWIVGTSLAFEAVVVALSAWIFCRRDY